MRSRPILSVAFAIVALFLVGAIVPAVEATNPCASVSGSPPPGNNPLPDIVGTVTENTNNDPPIQGATIELFKCVSGSGVSQGTDLTDASGYYEFLDNDDEEWYFVEALITGPLAGMSSSSGTSNPSDAVGLGESATIDLEFED